MFLDFRKDGLRGETHRCHVEAVVVHQTVGVGFHQGDGGFQRVGHIHHVEQCALAQRTDEFLSPHGRVEDVDGIVGGTSSGRGDVGDDAGETHRTGVDTVFIEIVVAEQFGGDFRHTVDGSGALDGVLWGAHVWRAQAERPDAAGGKHRTVVLACHLKYVPQSVDADTPCQLGLALCHDGEQCREIVDGIDVVFLHHLCYLLTIGDVGKCHGTSLT